MSDGWCPFAHKLPGPAHKVYSATPFHRKYGICLHEAEYDLAEDEQVLYNALFSEREASWHFTVTREGMIFQHYEIGVEASPTCWHCGYPGNLYLEGIELETTGNRKLTEPQYYALTHYLIPWIDERHGWQGEWRVTHWGEEWPHERTLREHNESQRPYTDCQVFSQGVMDEARLLADLKEEDMAEERLVIIERGVELQEEGNRIRADFEAWIARLGFPDEGKVFKALYETHIRWRVVDKDWR